MEGGGKASLRNVLHGVYVVHLGDWSWTVLHFYPLCFVALVHVGWSVVGAVVSVVGLLCLAAALLPENAIRVQTQPRGAFW